MVPVWFHVYGIDLNDAFLHAMHFLNFFGKGSNNSNFDKMQKEGNNKKTHINNGNIKSNIDYISDIIKNIIDSNNSCSNSCSSSISKISHRHRRKTFNCSDNCGSRNDREDTLI